MDSERNGSVSGPVVGVLPEPVCAFGYTLTQLEDIFGDGVDEFHRWFGGQTGGICTGNICEVAHGLTVYEWDLERYVSGLPVID